MIMDLKTQKKKNMALKITYLNGNVTIPSHMITRSVDTVCSTFI